MRNLFKILLLTFCGMVAITSCSDDSDGIPGWPWNDNSTEGPENPDVTEIKPRYVWIDAAANFPDYANNKENISTDMVKVKNAGFTDIIVDVRPTRRCFVQHYCSRSGEANGCVGKFGLCIL